MYITNKVLIFLISLLLLISLAGCGSTNGSATIGSTGSSHGATLSWTAPTTDANGTPYPQPNNIITGYRVYLGTSSGIYTTGNHTFPASTMSVGVKDLVQVPNSYYCVVTALDIYGNESSPSIEVQFQI